MTTLLPYNNTLRLIGQLHVVKYTQSKQKFYMYQIPGNMVWQSWAGSGGSVCIQLVKQTLAFNYATFSFKHPKLHAYMILY